MKIRIWLLLNLILILIISCSNSKNRISIGKDMREMPVMVAKVIQKSMPVQIRAIGVVEASSSVYIKAQVSGELKSIHFNEGEEVKEGTVLFKIDSAPYEAALKRAQATLAKDRVLEVKAREDVERYAELAEKEYITKEQYNQIVANAESLKEIVRADEAAVQSAQIDLDRCIIKAPISGKTGELALKVGNLVKAGDEKPLVVINRVHPVYVKFALPEKELPRIRSYMEKGEIEVDAVIPGYEDKKQKGELFFIDNAVDSKTGTIQAKAIFENKENMLWPGQYVDLIVILTIEPNSIVVPSQAVQTGQEGDFVFVVNGDNKVDSRLVKVSRRIGEEVIIEEGLKVDEIVVIDGQMQLVSGVKVQIKNKEVLQGDKR